MYIDPPYPGNKCNYAHNMRHWQDHHILHERLSATRCKWILSSYDTPDIRALHGDYFIIPVQSSSGMKVEKHGSARVINREVLVTNFAPPNKLLITQPMRRKRCAVRSGRRVHRWHSCEPVQW